jgi:hypothetical protein
MKIFDIYERAIKKALKEDPRPRKMIEMEIRGVKNRYKKLKGISKRTFDREKFRHPYDDSRLLYTPGNIEVKSVLVGIDIDVSEILLADRLRGKGMKIDLVIGHHPSGRAYAQLSEVLSIQPAMWEALGFKKSVAEGLMKERVEEVFRSVSSQNHTRTVDAARLLNVPFMCLHTAADNCVTMYLQKIFDNKKPKKLKDVMGILETISEYRNAMAQGSGPYIAIGERDDAAEKIFVDMTGGTNGPDRVFARLSQSGVKTIVGMHLRESGYKSAKSEFLNFVIAGHIASDSLGVNLLLDAVDPKKDLKIIECSGFKRFRR